MGVVKIGDTVKSKKTGLLFIVDGVTSFSIFMHPTKETPYRLRNHKYCRKRQFDMFYEKVNTDGTGGSDITGS